MTAGGLGHSPVAPGTAGTLAGVALVALLALAPSFPVALALAALAVGAIGFALAPWAERRWGIKDPPAFVLDEVLGYLVAMAGPRPPSVGAAAVGFVLFRIFDTVKPPPARRLERLRGGAGILLDDVASGVWSLAALHALSLLAGWP